MVFVGRVAVRTPRPVLVGPVLPRRPVPHATPAADPEHRCLHRLAGDLQARPGDARPHVEPADRQPAGIPRPEAELLHEPRPGQVVGRHIDRRHDGEPRALALVGPVADVRLVALQLRGDPGQLQHAQPLVGIRDRGRSAPRTGREIGLFVEALRVPTFRTPRPRPHVRGIPADVHRVDADFEPARIERRPGRELLQRPRGRPVEPGVVLLELLVLGVDPVDRHIEGHAVVEQCVVRQQPLGFERADPIVAVGLGELLPRALDGGEGGGVRLLVRVARRRGFGALLQVGQLGLDRVDAEVQVLTVALPAPGGVVRRSRQPRCPDAVLRCRPRCQRLPRGVLQPVESGEERLEQLGSVTVGVLDQVTQPRARIRRAEDAGCLADPSHAGLAGEAVDDGRQVLPLQDLLRGEVRRGRAHLPVDHRQRITEAGEGVAAAGEVREVEAAAGAPAGAADALEIGRDRPRQRGEHDGVEVADVDAHLQGRGGDEDVRRRRVDRGGLERVLIADAGLVVEHRRVFARDDAAHVGGGIEPAIVVVLPSRAPQPPGAAVVGAGGAVELVDDGGRAGGLGVAGVAPQQVTARLEVGQLGWLDEHVRGWDRIGVTGGGGDFGEYAGPGELGQQQLAQRRSRGTGNAQRLGRPAGVPALGRRHLVKQGFPAVERGTNARERRRRPAGGEGRHALLLGPATPDPPARAVLTDVLVQPLMPHRPGAAEAFEHAARPGDQGVVGGWGVECGDFVVRRLRRAKDHRWAGVDLGYNRAGGFERTPEPGLQAELELQIEQQPSPDVEVDPVGGVRRPLPERCERFALGDVGSQEPVPRKWIIPGRPQDRVCELLQVHRWLSLSKSAG